MRYWVRINKESLGPFTPEQIRQHPEVTEGTLVYPETGKSGADWVRLREVPGLLRASRPMQSAPPPPPPPSPPPVTGSSTPKTPSMLVKCPGCGKDVYRDAPNCPACGTPIPSRISAKRIGIALLIVFGLPLLFLVLAALLTPSPNDPIVPTAHVQKGQARPANPDEPERLRRQMETAISDAIENTGTALLIPPRVEVSEADEQFNITIHIRKEEHLATDEHILAKLWAGAFGYGFDWFIYPGAASYATSMAQALRQSGVGPLAQFAARGTIAGFGSRANKLDGTSTLLFISDKGAPDVHRLGLRGRIAKITVKFYSYTEHPATHDDFGRETQPTRVESKLLRTIVLKPGEADKFDWDHPENINKKLLEKIAASNRV